MKAVKTLFVSSRPLSWVNTAVPFGVAYYVVTERFDAPLIVGFLFFLIPYNVVMYGINDVFDYESDLRNPRKGGVQGALLPPDMHRVTLIVASILPLPFLVPLLMWGSFAAGAVLALSLLLVVLYSAKGFRFKEKAVLDSLTSSAHFVMPAIYGLVLAGATWSVVSVIVLASFFAWGMASHAFGAVQDVVADREAGVASIATVIGAKGTVRFAVALYAVAGLLLLAAPWPIPLVAPVALAYIATIVPWWSVADADAVAANKGWRWFLLLNFVAGAVVFLVLFEWWATHP